MPHTLKHCFWDQSGIQRGSTLVSGGRPGHAGVNVTDCLGAESGLCTEANQDSLYKTFGKSVGPFIASGIVTAVSPWTMNDFSGMSEAEDHFGIFHENGTKKAAANYTLRVVRFREVRAIVILGFKITKPISPL